jgi:hypothetical protein
MKILKILGVVLAAFLALIVILFVVRVTKDIAKTNDIVDAINKSDKVVLIMSGNHDDTKTVEVTDKADIDKLKKLCTSIGGVDWYNDSICGHFPNHSVRFINSSENTEIMVCPAADGCNSYEIEDNLYNIAETTRKEFDKTVKKYGMTFPYV